jgi:uroporphyrinogen decarboxylase
MNARERFIRTMRFQPVDRVPYWIPVFWSETHERWAREGHPGSTEESEESIFQCDRKVHVRMWLNFAPPFEECTLGDDEEYTTVQSAKGIVEKLRKGIAPDSQMHLPLRYPIRSREEYLNYRPRLTGNLESRLAMVKDLGSHNERDYTVSLRGSLDCGFYGPLRDLVGFERLNCLFYDDPALVEMMMDDRADLIIQMTEKILERTTIDWFCYWEDMAYKNGPLLSPQLFRKFMMPRYKRVNDFLHQRGVDLIFVDSDGDISLLIPLWLDCGVIGMWPFEVQAGMDVVKLRKEYGRSLRIIGGLDKRALAEGRKEIEAEILKKVPALINDGGYIPRPDHSIPPNVSYDNFRYFMDFLRAVLEKG